MSQPVDGLWFSTEKLAILRAGEKIFRVPQSILAARSPVFEAMFQFPQPSPEASSAMDDGEEVIEGTPVVRLFDAAEEVEAFLRAVFDSSYFMPPPAEILFRDLLGILRLSHKYDVGYLHKRALLHFETIYPVDIASLDLTRASVTSDDFDTYPALDLRAIPALHAVEAHWLLPYAYYSAATYTPRHYLYAGEAWTQLPLGMQQTCLKLHAIHLRGLLQINRFLAEHDESICTSDDACRSAKQERLRENLTHRAGYHEDGQDPLWEWREFHWDDLRREICAPCMNQARDQHRDDRLALWTALPLNCELSNWEVLLTARKAALD
ncbi:hypothetical protein C8R46DRAFT_1008163 [Mycena filopes]|nr:hypothetical protein C8R46DRAFT_1008163 [Mycena filopes]